MHLHKELILYTCIYVYIEHVTPYGGCVEDVGRRSKRTRMAFRLRESYQISMLSLRLSSPLGSACKVKGQTKDLRCPPASDALKFVRRAKRAPHHDIFSAEPKTEAGSPDFPPKWRLVDPFSRIHFPNWVPS